MVTDSLQGYTEAEQKRIAQMCHEIGIARDDPMFQLMATLGRYEETMIDLQARTEAMVEAWAVLIDQKLENTSKSAQSMHYKVVSSAVRDELKKTKPTSIPKINMGGSSWGIVTVSAIGGVVMAAGALLGSLTTWNIASSWGGSQTVVVTAKDLKMLEWAKSSQGRQMYELLQENSSTIQACQQENRLQGYCLIRMNRSKK